MRRWNHLWSDSDAKLDNDPEKDLERGPLVDMPIDNHPMENGVENQDSFEDDVGDG